MKINNLLKNSKFLLVALYIIILFLLNTIIYYIFSIFVSSKGIIVDQNLSQITIFFILLFPTMLFINNVVYSIVLIILRKYNGTIDNFLKGTSFFGILINSYIYSSIGFFLLIILIALLLTFIDFIFTLKGIFITLIFIVILLIIYIARFFILKMFENIFIFCENLINLGINLIEKSIPFFGGLFRILVILGITYFLIKFVDMRNISEIPIAQLTLKDIGKLILNLFIIVFCISQWLFNTDGVDYKYWFNIGIFIILGGIGFYIYELNGNKHSIN